MLPASGTITRQIGTDARRAIAECGRRPADVAKVVVVARPTAEAKAEDVRRLAGSRLRARADERSIEVPQGVREQNAVLAGTVIKLPRVRRGAWLNDRLRMADEDDRLVVGHNRACRGGMVA